MGPFDETVISSKLPVNNYEEIIEISMEKIEQLDDKVNKEAFAPAYVYEKCFSSL